MTKIDAFVSVVAPLQDDGDIIQSFVDDLTEILEPRYAHYEIVLVDDGSTDDTDQKLSESMARHDFIRLIRLSRRFGPEVAILAGLESVIGDFVVVIMPDTDPCERIPEMIELARQGAGIVSGVRRTREGQTLAMRLLAPLFYWYCNRILKLAIPRNTTEFRVLSRQVVNAIERARDLLRFLRMYSAYAGIPNATVTYDRVSRRGRLRRRTFGEVMQRSLGIIVANSTHPLRLVSLVGISISGLNVLYAVYVVMIYFLKEDVAPGWATQSLQSAVMFFFVFLTLAILSEYQGRILEERADRPYYFVMDEKKSSVILDEDRRKNVVGEAAEGGENSA